jgi:uncharacterized protein YvpB
MRGFIGNSSPCYVYNSLGSPYSAESFGVFSQPIYSVIDTLYSGRAVNLTGSSLDHVLDWMKRENTPVICWCTLELREPSVTDTWLDTNDSKKFKLL